MATANQQWKMQQNFGGGSGAGGIAGGYAGGYAALGQQADAERLAQQQRATARQQQVISGYDQLQADAFATRERNMGRVDQYGASMRQDLDIRNQQAIAAARQSAIKRGLGNTTIYDSLERGQQFDNTRQKLALEDQLLQNRISTDSSLSAQYQQMGDRRLGYIGGIQEDMSAFNSVANLYSQGLQMQNQNQQAAFDRANSSSAIAQYNLMNRPAVGVYRARHGSQW
jgi:hypothetical protein